MKNYIEIIIIMFTLIIISVSVCALGGYSMYITEGETGIGWAVLVLVIIWGGFSYRSNDKKNDKGEKD